MIGLVCCVGDRGEDIVALKIGVVLQNLLEGCICAEKLQDVGHAHPHPANAGPAAAFAGLDGDALEQF